MKTNNSTATAKTTETKTTRSKKIATKQTITESVYIQFAGSEYDLSVIKSMIQQAWMTDTNKQENDMKEMQIYIKPEEHVAYYVINGEFTEEGKKVML